MKASLQLLCAFTLIAASHVQSQDASSTEQPPEPKIRVRFNATNRVGVIDVAGGASNDLLEAFGDMVTLDVENDGDTDLPITVEVSLADRCADETAVLLFDEDFDVAPGGAVRPFVADELTVNDVNDLPCGPLRLCAVVTAPSFQSGIASLGLLVKCDQKPIDLAIGHAEDFDFERSYEVTWGADLLQQIPGLEGLLVANDGDNDMLPRSKDFVSSVLIGYRPVAFDQQVVEGIVSGECGYYDDEEYYMSSSTTVDYDQVRKRRSSSQAGMQRKLRARKKRYTDGQEEIFQMFDEWKEKRAEKNVQEIPQCVSNRFTGRDRVLVGGDITIPELDAGSTHELNLTAVKLQAKYHPCWESNGTIQLIVTTDPLGLYNDTDMCNDARIINITVRDCADQETYKGAAAVDCELMVDPISRGHRALILSQGDVHLEYNGEKMSFADEWYDWCKSFDYYKDLADLFRFDLLASRYQREMEENPLLCDEIDSNESGEERAIRVEAEMEAPPREKRRKRQINQQQGGDRQQGGNQQQDGDDERPFNDIRDQIEENLPDDLASHILDDMEDDEFDPHDFNSDEGIRKALDMLDDNVDLCPGDRGQSVTGSLSNFDKLTSLAEKVMEISADEANYDPLPFNMCGMRKVQQVLQNGGSELIAKDMMKFGTIRANVQDEMTDMVRFARALNTSLHETDDVDQLKDLVERKMNETADEEIARCGNAMASMERYYKPDDTYAMYWMVRGGKIYQGVRDFNSGFGEDNGNQRYVMWRQMASCTCDQCDWRNMVQPNYDDRYDWGWYNTSTPYYYDSTSYGSSSTTPSQ